jgi:hypothetical protein
MICYFLSQCFFKYQYFLIIKTFRNLAATMMFKNIHMLSFLTNIWQDFVTIYTVMVLSLRQGGNFRHHWYALQTYINNTYFSFPLISYQYRHSAGNLCVGRETTITNHREDRPVFWARKSWRDLSVRRVALTQIHVPLQLLHVYHLY